MPIAMLPAALVGHDGPHGPAAPDDPVSAVVREVIQNVPFVAILVLAGLVWVVHRPLLLAVSVSAGCFAGVVLGAVFGIPYRPVAYLGMGVAWLASVLLLSREQKAGRSRAVWLLAIVGVAVASAGVVKPHHRGDLREWTVVLGTAIAFVVAAGLIAAAALPALRRGRVQHRDARPRIGTSSAAEPGVIGTGTTRKRMETNR